MKNSANKGFHLLRWAMILSQYVEKKDNNLVDDDQTLFKKNWH